MGRLKFLAQRAEGLRAGSDRHPEAKCEASGKQEREADAADAGRPAVPIKELPEHGAADEPPEKVAGKIDAAGGAAVARRGTADEAGRGGLPKESADPDERQAENNGSEIWCEKERQPDACESQGRPKRPTCAEGPCHGTGERRRHDRRSENQVDETKRHHPE